MKSIVFIRDSDSVNVSIDVTLRDENNLDENFTVQRITGLYSKIELKLFYWLTKGIRWTLNELIFFATNNNLCLLVNSEDGTLLTSYGVCEIGSYGDFNGDFNNDFFI